VKVLASSPLASNGRTNGPFPGLCFGALGKPKGFVLLPDREKLNAYGTLMPSIFSSGRIDRDALFPEPTSGSPVTVIKSFTLSPGAKVVFGSSDFGSTVLTEMESLLLGGAASDGPARSEIKLTIKARTEMERCFM